MGIICEVCGQEAEIICEVCGQEAEFEVREIRTHWHVAYSCKWHCQNWHPLKYDVFPIEEEPQVVM